MGARKLRGLKGRGCSSCSREEVPWPGCQPRKASLADTGLCRGPLYGCSQAHLHRGLPCHSGDLAGQANPELQHPPLGRVSDPAVKEAASLCLPPLGCVLPPFRPPSMRRSRALEFPRGPLPAPVPPRPALPSLPDRPRWPLLCVTQSCTWAWDRLVVTSEGHKRAALAGPGWGRNTTPLNELQLQNLLREGRLLLHQHAQPD